LNLPSSTQKFAYNLRFPGQMFDGQAGLHQNYFRDFDPATGRYLESDLIGLRGGINPYAYVSGNPLTLADALGTKPRDSFSTAEAAAVDALNYVNTEPEGVLHPSGSLDSITMPRPGSTITLCGSMMP
jgi:RHS repeat-associated protein